MKLLDIVKAQPALQTLAATKLPIQASYRVAKALKAIGTDLALYEESRVHLLKEYGVLTEDGSRYNFETEEKANAFQTAMNLLHEEEVKLECTLLKVTELGDADLEPSTILPLLGVILEE